MKEKPLTKISGTPQELHNIYKKNTSETDINSTSKQKIVNLSDKNECPQCRHQVIKTKKSEHEFDFHESLCDDCKKDFWLITGSLTNRLNKKELFKVNITEFLLFS
ncbi:hypothetical protein [Flavobacterium chungnamense]|uniref:Transcription factor zinc-finger domain-containing protein n=1 Tax=Flavobacterium chungnamense TaxID=706182 RepID=A0ABP7UPA0_9FLAO